ncbi:endonuclease domain-containing protein [Arthrobacter sp. 2MCAF14]|uniref:endonuclease domain-containing protein n=1 Tax=Arthrobacter sp. 2MCAF14 TaxID=3232982 RepID=UPI003F927ED0
MSRTPMPPQLPNGSFPASAAATLGLSQKQLRRDGIVTLSRGLRLPLHSTGTAAEHLRGYIELDPKCCLSHGSAARILGISLPKALEEDWRIHLARPGERWKPRRRNVVGHQFTFKPGEVIVLDGVRLTSPARTWLDLAQMMSIDDIVAAGDSIVVEHGENHPRPREALATIEELKAMVSAHPGMRGVRKARLALDLVRVGADSPQETQMRLILLHAGLHEPALNHVILNEWGAPAVWPDAAYLKERVALQYDGRHHGEAEQYQRDIRRQALTERLGWREVRVHHEDLLGPRPEVVEKVRRALRGGRELAADARKIGF